MSLPSEEPIVLDREQLACLSAPVKREIFEAMMQIGSASINELASHLRRSPKGLYYHVRRLCEVGLMRVRETRRAGKRIEAVYSLASDRFVMEETEEETYRQAAQRSVSALLRRVDREFRAASESEPREGAITEVIRVITRLRPEAVERVLSLLREAAQFARENEGVGQGIEVTLTLFLSARAPRD